MEGPYSISDSTQTSYTLIPRKGLQAWHLVIIAGIQPANAAHRTGVSQAHWTPSSRSASITKLPACPEDAEVVGSTSPASRHRPTVDEQVADLKHWRHPAKAGMTVPEELAFKLAGAGNGVLR